MRIPLVLTGTSLALGLLLVVTLPAPRAEADPWGGYDRGGCGCAVNHSCPRVRAYRGACFERRHACRFLARGQGWSLLRRSLHRIRIQPTHIHSRYYFQRRWPCRYADGLPHWGGLRCVGADFPAHECPLTFAALGEGEEIPVSARELAPEDFLPRGMERFFRGAYDRARLDFEIAAKADSTDPRARYGLFLCDVMRKEWTSAVGHMNELKRMSVLDADDRLELDSAFEDPASFSKFLAGLAAWTQWNFHEVDAQVVAAWAFATTGEAKAARGHLRSALRFAPDHPVAKHLRATLDGAPAATKTPSGSEGKTPGLPEREPAPNLAQRGD